MKKVFVFHEVYDLSIFEKTIAFLSKKYEFKNLSEFISSDKDNICHITFDDGHYTFTKAFEILKRRNIPITLFISVDKILNENNFWFQDIEYLNMKLKDQLLLNFCQFFSISYDNQFKLFDYLKSLKIDEIHKFISVTKSRYEIRVPNFNISLNNLEKFSKDCLIELGSHTVNHPILLNETIYLSEKEIKDSIKNLNNFLGKKIETFAYPNGVKQLDYSEREKKILKSNGIKYAFTMNLHNFDEKKFDYLEIPRISLANNFFKNLILFYIPEIYNKLSKTNLPFIKKSEIIRRNKLKKISNLQY